MPKITEDNLNIFRRYVAHILDKANNEVVIESKFSEDYPVRKTYNANKGTWEFDRDNCLRTITLTLVTDPND